MAKEIKFVRGTPKRDKQGLEVTGQGMRVGAILERPTKDDVIIQVIDHIIPEYNGSVVKTSSQDLEYLTEEMELCKILCT